MVPPLTEERKLSLVEIIAILVILGLSASIASFR